MINWIKEFLTPPTFTDEDKTRTARLLYVVSEIGLVGAVIHVFILTFITRDYGTRLISTSIAIPLLLFEMALVKKGYVRFAAFFVVVTTWIGGNYITLYTGGVRDTGFGINLIVVLEAGMLISLSAGLVFGVLSSLVGLGMAIAQTHGLLPPLTTSQVTAWSAWSTQSLYLGLTAGLLYISVNYIQQSLVRSKRAEARLRGIIENTPDIILETDRKGIITLINRYQDRYLGKQVHEFIHTEDLLNVDRTIEQAFATGENISLEMQIHAPDDTLTWNSVRVGPIAQAGKVTSLAVIVTDITERKQAEKETRQRLNELATVNTISQVTASQIELDALIQLVGEKLRQVLNVHGVFIALYDPKSNIISFPYWRVRDGIMQVPSIPFGQGLIEWVICSRQPLVINDDYVRRSTELGVVRPALSQEAGKTPKAWLGVPMQVGDQVIGIISAQNYEQEDAFSENDIRLWTTIAANVGIAIQNAQLYTATQQELAERKRIQLEREKLIAELETKNAELERFAYTVSHDLKSPLITIRGFLGFIEQDTQSGNINRLKGDIQRISDATDKMQRLLNELLEISRVGRVRNEPKLIPFEELALEAVELVQGRIMERGIEVHIDSNMPTVFGDSQRLLEVLQNLVDNAAKFMGDQPDPRIEIGARSARGEDAERGEPVFYVKDNGIGIAPEHHERVFGLFNQLDPKVEGTGVGLTLVKRIVEFHGGRVWVESEAGKGATFCFTLPVPQTNKPI